MSEISKKILNDSRQQIDGYIRFGYENIAYDKDDQTHRTDYKKHAIITLDKLDDSGKNVKIPLINTEKFQKLQDPTKYAVLVFSPGGGRDEQSVGMLIRKDALDSELNNAELKTAKDNNLKGN